MWHASFTDSNYLLFLFSLHMQMKLYQVLYVVLELTTMCICLQERSNGNQGGPTQRASALAALSSAFNPSSGKSSHLVNNSFMQQSLINWLSSFFFDSVGLCFFLLFAFLCGFAPLRETSFSLFTPKGPTGPPARRRARAAEALHRPGRRLAPGERRVDADVAA